MSTDEKSQDIELSLPSEEAIESFADQSLAAAEIYYPENEDGFKSISISLNAGDKHFIGERFNGGQEELGDTDLDIAINELAGNIEGLESQATGDQNIWSAQQVLRGTGGNDKFDVSSREYDEQNLYEATSFEGSAGDDVYIGSSGKIEKISYERLDSDAVTGLYVSDKAENLPIISRNLPPLISGEFAEDDVLIYKQAKDELKDNIDIDISRGIDIIRLSEGNDTLIVTEDRSTTYDFGGGYDTAILESSLEKLNIGGLRKLEKIVWRKPDDQQNIELGSEARQPSVEFEVIQVEEDVARQVLVEDYFEGLNEGFSDLEWTIKDFKNGEIIGDASSWISLNKKPADPELVGQGRVVIYTKTVNEEDGDGKWLEIHALDLREDGVGLIGLDLDISWNNASMTVNQSTINENDIVNRENLPLFQNKGKVTRAGQTSTLENVVAAALPNAGTGIALGDKNELIRQTLFARIPYIERDASVDRELVITVNAAPAAGGIELEGEDLYILEEGKSDVWFLDINPKQAEVGNHALTIEGRSLKRLVESNVVISVSNTNDAPVVTTNGEDLTVKAKEGLYIEKDIRYLFRDDDSEYLKYEINSGPEWLKIGSKTGVLKGVPPNTSQGIHEIEIRAVDYAGLSVGLVLPINVENTNQGPTSIGQLALPNIDQGQDFTYRLPEGAFTDIDLGVIPEEKLTYSLHGSEEAKAKLAWLHIDPDDGSITGKPGNENVGNIELVIRATDKEGMYADLGIEFQVKNVNDIPVQTSKITEFLEAQEKIDLPINNPHAIFYGREKRINIAEWFDDIDSLVDNSEKLVFSAYLEKDDGQRIEVKPEGQTNAFWIMFDGSGENLIFNATEDEIGDHFLVVEATDSEGSKSSALIDFKVRFTNRPPVFNLSGLVETLEKQSNGGVKTAVVNEATNELTIYLVENKDFIIDLPTSLVNDPDLSVDPEETLNIELVMQDSNISSQVTFSSEELVISGTTKGMGLSSSDGKETWAGTIGLKDMKGETASLGVKLVLERTISEPKVVNRSDSWNVWDEGYNVKISELVEIEMKEKPDEILNLEITNKSTISNNLKLLSSKDETTDKNHTTAGGEQQWKFSGNRNQIIEIVDDLRIESPRGSDVGDLIQLEFSIYAQLGNNGLVSDKDTVTSEFRFDPIPIKPQWNTGEIPLQTDPFKLASLAEKVKVEQEDKNEVISYIVDPGSENTTIYFTDTSGKQIGEKDNNEWVFTAKEWKEAKLRTSKNDDLTKDLAIYAVSTEPSNYRSIQSDALNIKWLASPILIDGIEDFAFAPLTPQAAGEAITVPLEIELPLNTRTAKVEVSLPTGSQLKYKGSSVNAKSVAGGRGQLYEVLIDPAEIRARGGQLELEITSSELFKGEYTVSYEIYASTRESFDVNNINQQQSDLSTRIAAKSARTEFTIDVFQVAKSPEFNESDQGNGSYLNYDRATQQIVIPYRRGAGISGLRNKEEELMLSISNIPDGYALAEKVNGEYKQIGASDVFGTVTLFSIPKLKEEATDAYTLFNNGNLYLVKKDSRDLPTINHQMSIQLTASIGGQGGVDSRSEAQRAVIELTDIGGLKMQKLGKEQTFIDPLIIDLSGGEQLFLTSVDDSGSTVQFEMIPGLGAIKTGWISSTSNGRSGFLAINDESNDSNANIEISSITELFSEYFRANEGAGRTYSSGTDALKSLDTNNDLVIDSKDQEWNNILIWLDNGDGVSESSELKQLSEFVESINLGTVDNISTQPGWASGNIILRKTIGAYGGNQLPIYDVGLKVYPSNRSDLTFTANSPVQLSEGGAIASLVIQSPGSEKWKESGKDELTLVRLSGLPKEILPTSGVKDSRGDWLFTWKEIEAASGGIELIPDNNWSGDANVQLMISQVQPDGSMLVSDLKTVAVNIKAVADVPILIVKNQRIKEDTGIMLADLIKKVNLIDTDQSEELIIEVHNLSSELSLKNKNTGSPLMPSPGSNKIQISLSDLKQIEVGHTENISGLKTIEIHAVAIEKSNQSTAKKQAIVELNIESIPDAPSQFSIAENVPSLTESGSIGLSELIKSVTADTLLIDKDGSEELLVQIGVKNNIRLGHKTNSSWLPLELVSGQGTAQNLYTIKHNEISQLNVIDTGTGDVQEVEVTITSLSREIANGAIARSSSNPLEIKIPYIRNARPAQVTLIKTEKKLEDLASWTLKEILAIQPEKSDDIIKLKIDEFPQDLKLVGPTKEAADLDNELLISLSQLGDWLITPNANISGDYAFKLQVISEPSSGGRRAMSQAVSLQLQVDPVADKPTMQLNSNIKQLEINRTGWLDLESLISSIGSSDTDGSEKLYVSVAILDSNNNPTTFPENARFNNSVIEDKSTNSFLIPQSSLSQLKLYLGEIENDLVLSIKPISVDGASKTDGASNAITILSNIKLRAPILEIKSELRGEEDQVIPLMENNGGVLSIKSRATLADQSLELKLSSLPMGTRLVKKLIGTDGGIQYSEPINRQNNGVLARELRLDISQWKDVYLKSPADQAGTFSIDVQAFTVDAKRGEKGSRKAQLGFIIKEVNDAPEVINANDLESVLEGQHGSWNLKSRFKDVDNTQGELVISVVQVTAAGKHDKIPSWLSLTEQGILKGTPSNDDVSELDLLVTATDPLGKQAKVSLHLSVGNVNNPPTINHNISDLAKWQKVNENGQTILTQSVLLREKTSIKLGPLEGKAGSEALFSDPDSLHGSTKMTYSMSKDNISWSNKIENVAEIIDSTLNFRSNSKETIGQHEIFLKATDESGLSSIQRFRVTIINVNDPPYVKRSEATNVSDQFWTETVTVKEDEKDWEFNPSQLFDDVDPGDKLSVRSPWQFPSWVVINNNGVLTGSPSNSDVGKTQLTWKASDESGKDAYYRMDLNVENINNRPIFNELIKQVEGQEDSFTQLDLSTLVSDADTIHGDSLTYEYRVLDSKGQPTEAAEWLRLDYLQREVPDSSEKILIQPLFYSHGSDGTAPRQLSAQDVLDLKAGSVVKVKVVATDNRSLDLKGLVGIDLDLTWSDSLSVQNDSVKITDELPLFNSVQFSPNGMRVQAGSAPDGFDIGGAVGDKKNDEIISFNLVIDDPSKAINLSAIPGKGSQRDGLLDRYAEKLTENQTALHTFSTKVGAKLTFLSPNNAIVGDYQLEISAKDDLGVRAARTIPVTIQNTNDAPILDKTIIQKVAQFFEAVGTEEKALSEGREQELATLRLFRDDDLTHIGSNKDALNIVLEEKDNQSLDGFELTSSSEGSIDLSIAPPASLTNYMQRQVRIRATDKAGEAVSTDWFTAVFKPVAAAVKITTGVDNIDFTSAKQDFSSSKNIDINLASTLNLNALQTKQGDETVFKFSTPIKAAKVLINGNAVPSDSNIIKQDITEDSATFTISLHELANTSGKANGDISAIDLRIPYNEALLTGDRKAGIPITAWTETSVQGDSTNRFGIEKTEKAEKWITLRNSRPVFNQPSTFTINPQSHQQDSKQVIANLKNLFVDTDPHDSLQIELVAPEAIKDIISFDDSTGNLSIKENIDLRSDRYSGTHTISIRVKDSSGVIGDRSGLANGRIRLFIEALNSDRKDALGLNLLASVEKDNLTTILKKSETDLQTEEAGLKQILEKLEILNTTEDRDNLSDAEINKAVNFIEKIQKGSVSVLESAVNQSHLIVLETSTEDNILLKSSVGNSKDEIMTKASEILDINNTATFEAPMGELDFLVDTYGNETSLVEIQIPSTETVDSLIKTTSEGTPYQFKTTYISYREEYGDFQTWKDQLSYGIYDYSSPGSRTQSPILELSSTGNDLSTSLLQTGFSLENISNLDGSAYLIDIDSDGDADLISMMLVDQGWFDTRQDSIGLIGDPLTPVSVTEVPIVLAINRTGSSIIGLERSTSAIPAASGSSASGGQSGEATGGGTINNPIPQSSYVASEQSGLSQANQKQDVEGQRPTLNDQIFSDGQPKKNESSDTASKRTKPEDQSTSKPNIINDVFGESGGNFKRLFDSSIRMLFNDEKPVWLSGIIGMLAVPLVVERVSTSILKSFRQPPELKLSRRSLHFSGYWSMPTRNGINQLIHHNGKNLALVDVDEKDIANQRLEKLPGFDHNGESWLYSCIALSRNPGALAKSLEMQYQALQFKSDIDINWLEWLDKMFIYENQNSGLKPATKSLHHLKQLLESSMQIDPSIADVIMLAQLHDCCEQLGITTLLSRYQQ